MKIRWRLKIINFSLAWFVTSIGILATGYLVMYAIFLKAYFNDLVITINQLGEKDFEFWFLPASFIFAALGIIQYLRYKK